MRDWRNGFKLNKAERIDKNLAELLDRAYMKPKTIQESLIGSIFIEIGWILPGSSGFGICKGSGHIGQELYGVYVANWGTTTRGNDRPERDIEKNKIFNTMAEAANYIETLQREISGPSGE